MLNLSYIPSIFLIVLATGAWAIFLTVQWRQKALYCKHTTKLFCSCGNELISSDSFIRDVYLPPNMKTAPGVMDMNVVHYKCRSCKKDSYWNLDTPAPFTYPDHSNLIEVYNIMYGEGAYLL